jgi:acyl-CoA synthetase (AMP-forming)/AMP-acid ligase II
LAAQAAATPEAAALWPVRGPSGDATRATACVRFRELEAAAALAEAALAARCVGAGDRVAIVGGNDVGAVALLFACARLGAWAIVLNARLPALELDQILEHAAPRVVACTGEGDGAPSRPHAQRLGATPLFAADGAPAVARVGALATAALQAITASSPAFPAGHAAPTSADAAAKDVPQDASRDLPRDVAVMIYTSGTTGRPKGVMLTHANLLFVAEETRRLRRLGPGDVVYGALPLSHAYGLSSVLLATLGGGGAVRLVERPSGETLVGALADGALAEASVSVLLGVQTMYGQLVAHARAHGGRVDAPRLRYASTGGAPLDPTLKRDVEALLGLTLHNGYGLSETSPTITQTRDGAAPTSLPAAGEAGPAALSVGLPLPGVELRLEGGARDASGVGVLWVRGPNVMRGYFRDAAATSAVLTRDGWFNTQDLARLTPEGELVICGRAKELIIRSGFNVYPAEVEAVLLAFPGVAQAAVVGRAVPGNEEVVAFVAPAAGATLDPDALVAFARARLAAYKVPCAVHVAGSLPVTATGKVRKQELLARLVAAPA